MVEGADTDEANVGPTSVVAPQRNVAFWAAIDVMRAKSAPHGNGLQFAAQHLYGRGFDDGVEHEGAAGVPLAVGAMAAVHSDWLVQKLVAHPAAGATAGELFSCALCAVFHVLKNTITEPKLLCVLKTR
jgi:hypothetical protein